MAPCIWGAVFGSLGISLGEKGIIPLEVLKEAVAAPEVGLFMVLKEYPIGTLLSVVALVSLCAMNGNAAAREIV